MKQVTFYRELVNSGIIDAYMHALMLLLHNCGCLLNAFVYFMTLIHLLFLWNVSYAFIKNFFYEYVAIFEDDSVKMLVQQFLKLGVTRILRYFFCRMRS